MAYRLLHLPVKETFEMISLRTHNILDYVGAAVLIVCPFIFGFSDVTAARNLFIILGVALAAYSALTKYYYSVAKIIPVGPHMFLDVVTGFLLMIGPYAFNYRALVTNGQTALHFILGLAVWGLVALTRPKTDVAERGLPSDVTDIRRAA
jgi:hypothetical protein